MMGCAIWPSDSSSVNAEDYRLLVQRNIKTDLIKGPVQERSVNSDHGAKPAHSHSRSSRSSMLLCYANVKEAIRKTLREGKQAGACLLYTSDAADE